MLPFDLRSLARALGGEVANGRVLCPGPGHGPRDRSLSVRLSATAPDGFLVHSFAGGPRERHSLFRHERRAFGRFARRFGLFDAEQCHRLRPPSARTAAGHAHPVAERVFPGLTASVQPDRATQPHWDIGHA